MAPPSDNTSVITRAHTAYDCLRDTSIIVTHIEQEESMTKNNIVTALSLLNYFIHLLLRYDMKE